MPPIQPRYASGGEAQENSESQPNPIGLYRQTDAKLPGFGTEIGVLDPIQGDAVIRQGYELVEEGREAAMKTQKEMDSTTTEEPKSDKPNPGAK